MWGEALRWKNWGVFAVATTGKLAKLFLAISAGDVGCARRIASEIVAEEEKKGHSRAAKVLKGALNPNGFKPEIDRATAVEYPGTKPAVFEGLSLVSDEVLLSQVMLRKRWKDELESIVAEWKNRAKLAKSEIRHRSRLLFHGPPGCGKSLAARALGCELSLPTYVVRFDSIIGAYLGQTATHMRELFRFSERMPCVLLFDEIDALGKRRGSPLDVGELDRIVISLMQELEFCRAQGLVIATTNLATNLDDALWRRFDAAIQFPKPTKKELVTYGRKLSRKYRINLPKKAQEQAMKCKSYAHVDEIVENLVRQKALRGIVS